MGTCVVPRFRQLPVRCPEPNSRLNAQCLAVHHPRIDHNPQRRYTNAPAIIEQHRRLQKGNNGQLVEGRQPTARRDYNANMGGVDMSDQLSSTYQPNHKPRGFFWRRVFDHFLSVSVTNAHLMFTWWANDIIAQAERELHKMDEALLLEAGDVVVGGTAQGMTRGELSAVLARATTLNNTKRADWVRHLSAELMSKCGHGERAEAPKPKYVRPSDAKWEQVFPRNSERKCNRVGCDRKTRGACRCSQCRQGGMDGVVVCQQCFNNEKLHAAAAASRLKPQSGARAKRSIPWP